MNRIARAYDANPEYEWHRLERHRVEYGLTMKVLDEHLPDSPAKIADVGGSVGRYAIELTNRGYEVTLVDISKECLRFAQDKAGEAGVELAGAIEADARDMPQLADAAFDAVLLMGPLYHLLEHSQRVQAIREARRILRPGGHVFAAFVMRNSIVQYGLARQADYVVACKDELEAILSTGTCSPSHSKAGTSSQPRGEQRINDFWMAVPSEIEPLMSEGGFAKVDLIHCEALACELEDKINAAPEELHREWLDLLYRLSRDPSIMGGGGHILYVGRKP